LISVACYFTSSRFDEAIIENWLEGIYPMCAVNLDCESRYRTLAVASALHRQEAGDPRARMAALQSMRLALKYGILVTLVIAAWVALKHFVLHLESQPAQFADVAIFNLTAITGLAFGIREKRKMNVGTLTFGDGLITGIKIAVTYAILTSAYFALLLATVGPKMMQQEGETSVVKAFLGVSIGFGLFGTVFSAIIALVLRRR
jgi:FtsH-binding integral membrane protein